MLSRPCDNKVANLAARLVNLVAQPCSYKVGLKVEIWNYKVRCKVEIRFGSMRIWGNVVDQLFCIEWRRFWKNSNLLCKVGQTPNLVANLVINLVVTRLATRLQPCSYRLVWFQNSNVYTSGKQVLSQNFSKQNQSKHACLMCRHFKYSNVYTSDKRVLRQHFLKQNQSKPACLMCRHFKTQMSTYQTSGFWVKTFRNKINQNTLAWCVDISNTQMSTHQAGGF